MASSSPSQTTLRSFDRPVDHPLHHHPLHHYPLHHPSLHLSLRPPHITPVSPPPSFSILHLLPSFIFPLLPLLSTKNPPYPNLAPSGSFILCMQSRRPPGCMLSVRSSVTVLSSSRGGRRTRGSVDLMKPDSLGATPEAMMPLSLWIDGTWKFVWIRRLGCGFMQIWTAMMMDDYDDLSLAMTRMDGLDALSRELAVHSILFCDDIYLMTLEIFLFFTLDGSNQGVLLTHPWMAPSRKPFDVI